MLTSEELECILKSQFVVNDFGLNRFISTLFPARQFSCLLWLIKVDHAKSVLFLLMPCSGFVSVFMVSVE